MRCNLSRAERRIARFGVSVLVLGFVVSPALAEIAPVKRTERVADRAAPVQSDGVRAIAQPMGDTKKLISVLVYTDTNQATAALTKDSVRNFAAISGAFVKYEYKVLPGVMNLRDVHPDDVAEIARIPGVIKIESDMYHDNVVKLHDSIPLIRGLQSQITGAGYSANGSGVRVCIVDTGIDMDHVMYSSRIDTGASYDFHNNDSNPDDDHGHGTHCAGIALGGTGLTNDPCGTGPMPFQGLAPSATLIGAKVLSSAGGGTDSNIIAGIDHCADQTASGGRADVISMSIGTGNYSGICTHSWAVAANNAAANGVVAIAASGNENNANSMGSPACGADVIAVGMTWKNDYPTCEDNTTNWGWGVCTDSSPQTDDVGCFSNESDFLDVTAPGANIWSASNAAGGSSITGKSGTSMSCPTVAGLAALILQVEPTATPAQLRQYIRDGAIDMGPAGFDRAYGYGRIDVLNTLSLLTPCAGDGDCDDGNWCNGSETCNVGSGSCVAGSDPCPGESCDEANDVCVAAPTVQYSWNMNANPGWTMNGDWAYGQPSGGGGQHGSADPTSGATGNNVIGFNLAGDYANSLAETHMTTTAIDCTGFIDTSLRFQRWLGVETPTYDHAYIRVSTNGSTWTQVWTNGSEVADSAWGQVEYDISAVADGQSTVYVRWTMGTTDSSWQYCGWNIDDVEILATSSGGATCSDGILNQGEDRIDCGGPCTACNCLSDGACDNAAFCDGTETCDTFGNCQGGTAVDCNDGVGCTDDSCNEGTDSCDNVANDTNCDNGAWCDGAETCHATNDCQSGTAVNCNDGVGCTDDSCNEGTDSCDNVANDANCDNGAWCDGSETCHATNDCQAGTSVNCDDGVACTTDSCNEGTDSCDNAPNDAACDDGTFCNGAETCHATLDCQAGGEPCPGQQCDEGGDTCVDCTVDGDCDDGAWCNGAETCVAGACQAGTAVNCGDGVGCTDDSCNEATDSCDNVANDANCDNGLWCDGAETCDAVSDCQAGTTVNCDDGVGCTDDSCNDTTDSCDNATNDANCDNGLWCDGAETCNAVSDCLAGTAVNCDDGVGCTDDSCNETTDTCDNVSNDAACDDGVFCNGAESCSATLDCQAGSDPCPGQTCDEAGDACVDCQVNGDCDDGLYCNGSETCNAGTCQAGAAVNCDDGVTCTDDSCNEATDSCDNVASDANCDNGLYCDGAETCNAVSDCQAGTAVNCDDAVGCTADSCNEATDSCDNVTNDAACDNGLFCDGAETCDAVSDCQPGTAVNCDDGVACTDDSCNEATDSCDNAANDANCDNGLWCDGAETCNAVSDCQAGGDPCPGQSCDEAGDACVDCLTNGDCDDGAYCNGAETCAAGVCQAGTAVDCDDGVGCTADSCNEGTDSCDNAPNDAACDDALFCNGSETCHATLDCQAGTAVNCDDGVACTDDSCNEATDSCDNVANNANCPDDAVFCNGTESCDAISDCVSSGDPCGPSESCNEATDTCDPALTGEGFIISRNADLSTDDRTFYFTDTMYMLMWSDVVDFNTLSRQRWEMKDSAGDRIRLDFTNNFDNTYTASFALSGLPSALPDWTWKGEVRDDAGNRFRPQVPVTVLDAPACTVNADCDDADGCTTDVCSAGACSNTPVVCDDGDACTTDSCNAGTGACDYVAVSCDDGDACTTDACDAGTGCSNTPISCDDGDPCTSDSCSGGACVFTPLATCCGDATCDPGEDECNCPADCGAPPATETNCTDGVDEDCDGSTDCFDTDCNGDPACAGPPPGEGFILSRNADFSTDDRVFTSGEVIYMYVWTDLVDFNDLKKNRWELKDANGDRIREPLVNGFDGTYTATFNTIGLPSALTSWTWKGSIDDNGGTQYRPTTTVTVNPVGASTGG